MSNLQNYSGKSQSLAQAFATKKIKDSKKIDVLQIIQKWLEFNKSLSGWNQIQDPAFGVQLIEMIYDIFMQKQGYGIGEIDHILKRGIQGDLIPGKIDMTPANINAWIKVYNNDVRYPEEMRIRKERDLLVRQRAKDKQQAEARLKSASRWLQRVKEFAELNFDLEDLGVKNPLYINEFKAVIYRIATGMGYQLEEDEFNQLLEKHNAQNTNAVRSRSRTTSQAQLTLGDQQVCAESDAIELLFIKSSESKRKSLVDSFENYYRSSLEDYGNMSYENRDNSRREPYKD